MQNQDKFSEICTIHGVRHIFSSNHYKIVRLFWVFLVLLSICGFFFYLQIAWIKLMYEPEVLIKTRERNAAEFPFPAVTICPNIFAQGIDYRDSREPERNFTTNECKVIFSNLLWMFPIVLDNFLKRHCVKKTILDVNIVETILNSSIPSNELFLQDFMIPQRTAFSGHGPCFTFNGLSYGQLFNTEIIHDDFKQFQKFVQDSNGSITEIEDNTTWSPEKGFETKNGNELHALNTDSNTFILKLSPNYTKYIGIGKTFKMFLHKPNEIVTTLNVDYIMNYNESKRFRLKVKSRKTDDALREFSPESRKCYFEDEKQLKFFKSYTKLNCEWECKTKATLRECGCVLYTMPRDKTTKVCNFDEMSRCKPNKTECDCYPPCNDLTFEITSEIMQFDALIYELLKITQNWSLWCGQFLTDDFVEEIEYYSAYRTQNFIAEFGGFLGLFMGCSLLSIVEFLFYFLLAIHSISLKLNKKVKMQSTTDVNPVIWGNSGEKIDKITETLNTIGKNIEDIQREHKEAIERIDKNLAKMEARFVKLEKKFADNLILEDF